MVSTDISVETREKGVLVVQTDRYINQNCVGGHLRRRPSESVGVPLYNNQRGLPSCRILVTPGRGLNSGKENLPPLREGLVLRRCGDEVDMPPLRKRDSRGREKRAREVGDAEVRKWTRDTDTCDVCGYTISTLGPWEFYRDANGERKLYGHPVPISEEAARGGIHGLSGIVYCSVCDRSFDLILVEFKEPCYRSLLVWAGQCEPKDEYKKEDTVKCPFCGNTRLVFCDREDADMRCPWCGKGRLVARMEWIC